MTGPCWLSSELSPPATCRMAADVQVTLIFGLPPLPAPPARYTPGPSQVYVRSITGQPETGGLGADRSLATADRAIRTQCALLPWAR